MIEAHTRTTKYHVMHHLQCAMGEKNDKRFTTKEQRQEQLEQTKHATPKENEEDAKRPARAHTSSSHWIPTRHNRRNYQEVPPGRESKRSIQRPGNTQITSTSDPATRAIVTFTTKPERNNFVKTPRRSQHEVGGGNRPTQRHEDPFVGGMSLHKQLGYAECSRFIDRKNKLLNITREVVAETHPEVPEHGMPTHQSRKPSVSGCLDVLRGHAVNTANMEQTQTCTRQVASNLAPSKGGGRAHKTALGDVPIRITATRPHSNMQCNADDPLTSRSERSHHMNCRSEKAMLARYHRHNNHDSRASVQGSNQHHDNTTSSNQNNADDPLTHWIGRPAHSLSKEDILARYHRHNNQGCRARVKEVETVPITITTQTVHSTQRQRPNSEPV